MVRSALPTFFPDVGRSGLLVERLGGVLDRPGCDPALVFRSALRAFAPWVGWPGRPAKLTRGLLKTEELVQQMGVVGLGHNHLVLQATPQTGGRTTESGGVSCKSAGEAVGVTARQLIEAIQRGGGGHPTVVVSSRRRRASTS